MLIIKNLHACVEDQAILNGVNLEIRPGEIHAIMGPNGAGKSTLAKILSGHPSYEVTAGEIWFKGENLLEMEPEKRAALGLFMSFQYPPEIPGVTNIEFLKTAMNSILKERNETTLSDADFQRLLEEKMTLVDMKASFSERFVNEGFSGGEKKRNEILQMAMLDPSLAILDETDSGLDIDAMRIVAAGVSRIITQDKGLLVITHYQRLLDYIKPHFVHVMIEGKIVHTSDHTLALELEEKGYDWLGANHG